MNKVFENDVKMYGTQTVVGRGVKQCTVWEWCKNVWYSNSDFKSSGSNSVWEWCKNVWYSNFDSVSAKDGGVWEWCKNVWYSNCFCIVCTNRHVVKLSLQVLHLRVLPEGERKNGVSPIKSIIKKVTQTMIKSPFKAVKWWFFCMLLTKKSI